MNDDDKELIEIYWGQGQQVDEIASMMTLSCVEVSDVLIEAGLVEELY